MFLLVLVSANAFAANTTTTVKVGDLNYTVDPATKEAEVTGAATNYIANLVIPDEITYNEETYAVTSIAKRAFKDKNGFRGTLTLGNKLVTIGDEAFSQCTGFVGALKIPNSVVTIGNSAFDHCTALNSSLTIGSSVMSIGEKAFYFCSNLTGALTIPNSVTFIGDYAFDNCSRLAGRLTLSETLTSISRNAFKDCSRLTGQLNIPGNSVAFIEGSAFGDCNGATILHLPASLLSVGTWAFWCEKVRTVICEAVIPPAVISDYGIFLFFCPSRWNPVCTRREHRGV